MLNCCNKQGGCEHHHHGHGHSHGVYHGGLVQSVGQVIGFHAQPMVSHGIPGQVQLMPHFVEPVVINPVAHHGHHAGHGHDHHGGHGHSHHHHRQHEHHYYERRVHHHGHRHKRRVIEHEPHHHHEQHPAKPAVDYGGLPVCGADGCMLPDIDLGNLSGVPVCGEAGCPVPAPAPTPVCHDTHHHEHHHDHGCHSHPHTLGDRKYHFSSGDHCGCEKPDCRSCRQRKEDKRRYG